MLMPLGRRPVQSVHGENYDTLVKLLRESREAAGISQERLAKKLGWTQSQVSYVESGDRRLDLIEFLDYAKAAGFDASGFVQRLEELFKC